MKPLFRSIGWAASIALAVSMLVPTTAQAECGDPADVATEFLDRIQTGACATPAEAESLCKNWFKLCKKQVNAVSKCATSELKAIFALSKKQCKLEQVPSVKSCLAVQKNKANNTKTVIKSAKQIGYDECLDAQPTCEATCD
jgi:hypothetical protein